MHRLLFKARYFCKYMPKPLETIENLENLFEELADEIYPIELSDEKNPLKNLYVCPMIKNTVWDHLQCFGQFTMGASYLERKEFIEEMDKTIQWLNDYWSGRFKFKYRLLNFKIYHPDAIGFVVRCIPLQRHYWD